MRNEKASRDTSYSQHFLDMDSLLGTTLNYKKDPYVHCKGSFSKANTDSNSYDSDGLGLLG